LPLAMILLAALLAAPAAGQAPGPGRAGLPALSGTVLDPSGAAIPDARVALRKSDGGEPAVASTDQAGAFRFEGVAPGNYQLEVQREGFTPVTVRVTVGNRLPASLRIKLALATVREELTVGNETAQTNTNPAENLDSVRVDREALDNLPVLGRDIVGALAPFLDSSSLGTGGVTLVVDGMETSEKGVAESAIQEVRINQNPYSAEFSRPGHGRIEIFTIPGSSEYHGTFQLHFRDHHLDARNAFAARRPEEQRRVYYGHFTGPLGKSKKTTFLLSGAREEGDLESVVFARTLSGLVQQNVPNPQRDTELSARINHQFGQKHTVSLRYEFTDESAKNQGAGGFQLPEVTSDSVNREHHIYYNHRTLITPKLVNEFSLRGGTHDASTSSRLPGARKIVVLDAFTGGGAQADLRTTEHRWQFNDVLSWSQGRHFLKAGINVPDFSRRGSTDRGNFDGTFLFSSLEDYAAGRPFLFTLQQGEGHLAFWQKDLGLFVQDDVRLRPNLSVGLGLRYDWQNFLGDHNNFAPRIGFAFAPGKSRKTVLRGGWGLFYDRTGPGAVADLLRYDGLRLRQLVLSNPGYPDPLSSGGSLAAQPSSMVRFAPGLRSPYALHYSIGVERQLVKATTLTVNYNGNRGLKLFRSRDVNAPRSPLYAQRPDPGIAVLRQIESSAGRIGHWLAVGIRGNISRYFDGNVRYNYGRVYNNSDGINSFPADSYDLSGEWARADYEGRQHLHAMGTLKPGKLFSLGIMFSFHSGRPYSLTTGRDVNRDSRASDRPPGVRRNTLEGPEAVTLDLRWSRDFFLKPARKDKGPVVTVSADAFNVLNRVNYAGFVGNLSSPFFGQPVASRPARRVQLSFRLKF